MDCLNKMVFNIAVVLKRGFTVKNVHRFGNLGDFIYITCPSMSVPIKIKPIKIDFFLALF